MTEGQARYQTLVENQRHNLEMERLGALDSASKAKQAEASLQQADVAATNAKTEQRKLKANTYSNLAGLAERATSNMWSNGNDTASNFIEVMKLFFGGNSGKGLSNILFS